MENKYSSLIQQHVKYNIVYFHTLHTDVSPQFLILKEVCKIKCSHCLVQAKTFSHHSHSATQRTDVLRSLTTLRSSAICILKHNCFSYTRQAGKKTLSIISITLTENSHPHHLDLSLNIYRKTKAQALMK